MSKKMSAEMEQFLNSLKGADQLVIDMTAANAFLWATHFKLRGIDLFTAETWLPQQISFPIQLHKLLRDQQKQQFFSSATGLMVWLHTCRALTYPELRFIGREMWKELSKASDEANDLYIDMIIAMDLTRIEYAIGEDVPAGLETPE